MMPNISTASLTAQRGGVYTAVSVGSGNGGVPFAGGLGWHGGVGLWVGRYDEDMALGRHWGFAASVRQDWIPGAQQLRTAPMLEVRRGFDLLAVGFSAFVAGGPLLHTGSGPLFAGGTARLGGNVKWRFHANWGLNLRVEGGVDLYGGPALSTLYSPAASSGSPLVWSSPTRFGEKRPRPTKPTPSVRRWSSPHTARSPVQADGTHSGR